MAFVSCSKQVSSLTAALGAATTAEQSALVKAFGSAKEVSFATFTPTTLKPFQAKAFGAQGGEGGIAYTTIGWDSTTNTSFGNWNGTRDTFTFTKAGVFRVESNLQLTAYFPVYSDLGIAMGVHLLFKGTRYQGLGFNANTRDATHFGAVSGGNSWLLNVSVGDTVTLQGYRSGYTTSNAQSTGEVAGLGSGTTWLNTFTISQY